MIANRFAGVAVAKSLANVAGNKPRLAVAGNDADRVGAEVKGGDISHRGLRRLHVCYNHRHLTPIKGR